GGVGYVEIHQAPVLRAHADLLAALAHHAARERLLLRPRLRALRVELLRRLRLLPLELERLHLLLLRVMLRPLGEPPGVVLRLLRLQTLAAQLPLGIGERPLRGLDVALRLLRLPLLLR